MKNSKIKYAMVVIILILIIVGAYILISGKEDKVINEKPKDKLNENIDKTINIVDVNSKTRPMAIMINNEKTVRPYHSGLQDAYIIYEMVVEGGITRYLALFKDVDTQRIHGIRSARHYYVDYALENDAYYIHWGASPQARKEISKTGVNAFEVYDKKYAYYDRSLNLPVEHTTYSSYELLKKGVKTKKFRSETNSDLLLNYSAEAVDVSNIDNKKDAKEVDIKYSSSYISNFRYDSEAKVYYMSVNGKAHTDYITKDQYNFKNIITYKVNNYTLDDPEKKGRQELENIGEGSGYYISNGVSIPITWEKESNSSQTVYKYENGKELKVNDGNTFIAIQPVDQPLTIK